MIDDYDRLGRYIPDLEDGRRDADEERRAREPRERERGKRYPVRLLTAGQASTPPLQPTDLHEYDYLKACEHYGLTAEQLVRFGALRFRIRQAIRYRRRGPQWHNPPPKS